ncbi:kinase-like domain-containing protein [Rhizophagus clarus]|uniref:Kinase-like domain-containing protein n=1 Tax=Rhizophagus clarus TaxID=94130 RepID=A0A8H3LT80_9GLOM|nr:kinase-like domain-containing protein [Rhizophagus clarus]
MLLNFYLNFRIWRKWRPRGFSIIYKAILSDKSKDKEVILKRLKTLNDNLNEFLNEWKYHESCLDSYEIINLHGFTKDPITSNYMVVIDYANQGNLRRNLTRIIKYNWKQKLYLLYKIISGLHEIHNQNLVHCDFHDGNILNHKNEEYKKNKMDKVYISDLGLCQPIKSIFKKDNIYGVIPFMAPEILRGEHYTSASDIYSFSMIMWEFTSGVPPFNNRAHDLELSVSICKGERPKIVENTPQCYVNLMKKCWNNNPFERPSASEVLKIIEKWIYVPFKMGITDISEEIKSNVMEFINAPTINNELITEYHPQAYRTSRLLNFTSKKLNEILNNEYLDDVSTFNDTKSLLDTNTHENTEID